MVRSAAGWMVLVGGLVVIAACGDDPPPEKFPTADAFCGAKATEECDAVAAVCSASADACEGARRIACNEAARQAMSEGRVYTPGNAQACLDRTKLLYADRVLDAAKEEAYEDACARVFAGTRKKRDACKSAYECEGTLVCDVDKGFCAEKVTKQLNDPCNNPGDICDEGLFCQLQGTSRFCSPKVALGGACNPDLPCADDLQCNGTTCVALQEAGQPCETDAACKTGFCNPDRKSCQARQYASETGTCKDFGGS